MFTRSLAGAVLVVGLGATSLSQALSLGELRLNSSLNQPLDARINLRDTGNLSGEQITVKLASAEDFDKAGVDYSYLLSKLSFSVEIDQQGNGIVKVHSSDPIVEPYLNFLVEARWPAGRMLREYTVLLDLPAVSNARTSSVSAAQGGSATQAAAETPATREEVVILEESGREGEASTGPKPREDGQRTALPQAERPTEYRVQHNDMLWDIAERYRPEGATVQQTMLALLRKNPRAFIGDNINRLKSGYVLRLPTADEARQLGQDEAVKEIRRQNAIWRGEALPSDGEPAVAPQLDATPKSSEETPKTESRKESRLSIATPGSADSEGSDGTAAARLRDELAANQENLDKVQRENAELGSRLEDLERQLATLQRLLELKDDQLATLQQQMGADAPVEKPAATPQATPETVEEGDSLLDSPAVKYGVPGILLLALLVLLLRRFSQKKTEAAFEAGRQDPSDNSDLSDSQFDSFNDNDSFDSSHDDEDDDAGHTTLIIEPNREPETRQGDAESFDDFDDLIGDDTATLDEDAGEDLSETISLEPSAVEQETDDALAEAEIYVAYGRYEQAAQMLKNAISKEPARTDLRTKLLGVYLETRDREKFISEFQALEALGDQDAVAEVKETMSAVEGVSDWLRDESPSGDETLVFDTQGDAGTSDTDAPTADDFSGADFDFDLDDDFGETLISEPESATESADSKDDELELDDLELDARPPASSSQDNEPAPSVQEPESAENTAAREESDEFSFDLSLDDDLSLEEPLANEELSASEKPLADDELSLDDLAAELAEDDETLILSPQDDTTETSAKTSALSEGESDDEFSFDLDDELTLDSGDLSSGSSLESDDEDEFSFELDDELSLDTDSDASLNAGTPSAGDGETPKMPEPPAAESAPTLEVGGDALESNTGTDEDLADLDSLEDDMSDDLGLLGDSDEVATKLDLARAYIDMGDAEGAREMLQEVMEEGNDEQKQDANELLSRL